MSHKTLIGGTAYDVTGGKTLIGGTGYDMAGGKTLIGGTAYDVSFSPYNPTFSANTWAEIIEACQNGTVHPSWKVGNKKSMTINGVSHYIAIIGKDHDTYADGSGKAPLTFQPVPVVNFASLSTANMASSTGNSVGWDGSIVRTSTLPTILALMPEEVQAAIKEVNKKTSAGNKSTTKETTADGLFLLSEIEVFGTSGTYSVAGEGSQYEYYANGGSTIKKDTSGSARYWWLRSPNKSSNTGFCYVKEDGTIVTSDSNSARYICPAFCF